MAAIDFWFSIGSTYSFLSVMRLPEVERETGIAFRWKPFNVREIMLEMDNRPFVNKPAKTAYMWRDLARRAELHGLTAKLPAPYPLEQLELANRVAVVGVREGWCADYAQATYRRWIGLGQPAGSSPNLEESLAEVGQDAERVLALARSQETGRALDETTAAAKALGIFGSPTFVVGRELFWGDDRLEDALSWHSRGRVTGPD